MEMEDDASDRLVQVETANNLSGEEVPGRDGDDGRINNFRQPIASAPTHKDKTARVLALASFLGLCFVFGVHFASVFYLVKNRPDAIEHMNRVFATWVIPIFAGLVGSAATFYFTQDRR